MTRTALGDRLRTSFWVLPALGMIAGLALGVGLPALDAKLELGGLGLVSNPDDARAMLQSIATGSLGIVGVTFTVTVVALQLASQQLSPRVLRTFQSDRVAQSALAALLGTFVLALLAIGRVGENSGTYVPGLSVTASIAAALATLGLFVAFVHGVIRSLQASHLIARIAVDGRRVLAAPYPSEVGEEPGDEREGMRRARERMEGEPIEVDSPHGGYLTHVRAQALLAATGECDGFVRQVPRIGEFVLTGGTLAHVWPAGERSAELADRVRACFQLGEERTAVRDVSFPARQLVDVALRALSPSLNDPTTAENAMNSVGDFLIRAASAPKPALLRVGGGGEPRFLAARIDFDALVGVGFDQVRRAASGYPLLGTRLVEILAAVRAAAEREGESLTEIDRQERLIRADVERVE